ncbi:MAG TPA: DUF58 domain-containing protein [Anaerolineales bacterium]|nr:DUF58 domain-containing protein [Anaerolineales bacterium]
MLFDETTLRKLKQLTLVASRVRTGAIKGDRRSSRRGSSVEFADYRDYTPGDDLRRLDWNIYARLERPFIKMFEEEEDLAVYILLDGSRSMDWGEGEQHKFLYALRLCAGLGAIALASGDALSFALLQSGGIRAGFGPMRGEASLSRMFDVLEGLQPGGSTQLNESLHQFAVTPRRPGLVILISDLLSADQPELGLRPLLARGSEAAILHLLSPDELDPPLSGDLQLVDVETGAQQVVSLDGRLRTLYQDRVRSWIRDTRGECRKHGVGYVQFSTARPWDQLVLLELRRSGILK